jgi:hypothetical protein
VKSLPQELGRNTLLSHFSKAGILLLPLVGIIGSQFLFFKDKKQNKP